MLRIENIKLSEKYHTGENYFEYDSLSLHDINLIIGPNASGKSQFFSRLRFLKETHTKGKPTRTIKTIFTANIEFIDTESSEKICYDFQAGPGELIVETIKNMTTNTNYLKYDQENALLVNEKTGKEVSFLINKRQSITKQIEDHKGKFPTIYEIGKFFESILFLDTDKFNPHAIEVGQAQLIPSDQMANISSVVLNWKKRSPKLYNILLAKYKMFFPSVEDFTSKPMAVANGQIEMLAIKEKGVKEEILAPSVSSGMLRILCLLALPMTRQLGKPILGYDFSPSMIIIDEIDNGLDYEVTANIIDYLESETSFSQIIFSSHSPVVCNFVPPQKWHIFRRLASKVKVTSPFDIKDTKELIEKSKSSNWEIYKNHIANSQLYSVQ